MYKTCSVQNDCTSLTQTSFHCRLSRDEKLYQKDLEAALQASIRESQLSSAGNDSSSNANDEGEGDISDEEELRPSKPKKARLLPSSDTEDNDKENTGYDKYCILLVQ